MRVYVLRGLFLVYEVVKDVGGVGWSGVGLGLRRPRTKHCRNPKGSLRDEPPSSLKLLELEQKEGVAQGQPRLLPGRKLCQLPEVGVRWGLCGGVVK